MGRSLPIGVEQNSFLPGEDNSLLSNEYTCDIDIQRFNRDKNITTRGKHLLEICTESKMRILNGRFLGDSVGNFTYFDPQGGCSVIDYMIASEDLLSYVTYFKIMLCLSMKIRVTVLLELA